MQISVVIPCLNEEESLEPLGNKLVEVLSGILGGEGAFEIIFVDDGSTDSTAKRLAALKRVHSQVRVVRFRRNFGKAAALDAGFRVAGGRVIITMDADLQDDPEEIPRMLEALDQGYDVVSGWKSDRKDPLSKTLPSKLFNRTLAMLSGIKLHDYNCGFKAYRSEAVRELVLYGELHRYIPVLLYYRGFRITEIAVKHHPRRFGHSKYGFERYTRGLFDLLTVILLTRYATRPLHAFGGIGLILGTLGGSLLIYLTAMKLAYGVTLGDRPLLLMGILLVLVGIQLVSTGLLGEMLTRTQNEAHRPFALIDVPEEQLLALPPADVRRDAGPSAARASAPTNSALDELA
ncbi:MAG: glycosyltransferase family 2 protein [Bradymonadaceae bacterium]|nr:glycosyltransferase family 2 protein [Lujinxingiaceae bacterium]